LDISLTFRSADIGKHMNRKAAVAIVQPPHLQAEPDVAGLEDFSATVVLDGISLADEGLSGAGLHLGENALYCGHVDCRCDVLIPGSLQHIRQFAAQYTNGPPDGVTVRDRVHPAVYPHTTANPPGGRKLRIFRAVNIGALQI